MRTFLEHSVSIIIYFPFTWGTQCFDARGRIHSEIPDLQFGGLSWCGRLNIQVWLAQFYFSLPKMLYSCLRNYFILLLYVTVYLSFCPFLFVLYCSNGRFVLVYCTQSKKWRKTNLDKCRWNSVDDPLLLAVLDTDHVVGVSLKGLDLLPST